MHRIILSLTGLALAFAFLLSAASAGESGTVENLKAAHQASLDAKARYEAFAAKAAEEGYKSVAALFRAAARSEDLHVGKYVTALKAAGGEVAGEAKAAAPEVKSTKENIEAAIAAKTEGVDKVLPGYAKQAEADKQTKAAIFFKGASLSDAEYVKLLGQAKGDLDGWKAGDKEFFVCTVCSYVMTDPNVKQCPICAAPRDKFESFK